MQSTLSSAFSKLLESFANSALSLDVASRTKLRHMDGRCIQICSPQLSYSLFIAGETIHVYNSEHAEWDVRVEGSVPELMKLLLSARSGDVRIDGDETLLSELRSVFRKLNPDLETPLARLLGEAPAQALNGFLQFGLAAGKTATHILLDAGRSSLNDHVSEHYLKRDVLRDFLDRLHDLSVRVDRTTARVEQLEAAHTQPEAPSP